MNMELSPKSVFYSLLLVILLLFLAHMGSVAATLCFGNVIEIVDFGCEHNIPTLYSSCTLVASSGLLLGMALLHKRNGSAYFLWIGLAVVFLFLSVDEIASIHERLAIPVRKSLGTSGLLFYAWVIPYGVGLTVFLGLYTPFLISLPRRTAFLFILSGAIYVSGAIGLEMLGGKQADLLGGSWHAVTQDAFYVLLSTCEELCEMLGIAVFVYAILSHMTREFDSVTITMDDMAKATAR